jgi:hypothetical protein
MHDHIPGRIGKIEGSWGHSTQPRRRNVNSRDEGANGAGYGEERIIFQIGFVRVVFGWDELHMLSPEFDAEFSNGDAYGIGCLNSVLLVDHIFDQVGSQDPNIDL